MKNFDFETDLPLPLESLRQNWEAAVALGLQRMSDDALLGLLGDVSRHVDDADDPLDVVFADAPDWDNMSASELDAVALQFGVAGTSSGAVPVRAPVRRRPHHPSAAKLSFEELESRFSPSAVTVMAHGRASYAPACAARWAAASENAPATPCQAMPSVRTDSFANHVIFDFDAESLHHLALAQVA